MTKKYSDYWGLHQEGCDFEEKQGENQAYCLNPAHYYAICTGNYANSTGPKYGRPPYALELRHK
jgi:hypothetical protein